MSDVTVLEDTRRRLRERALASDGRAGTWARAQARRKRWVFIGRSWTFILTTIVAATGVATAATCLSSNLFVRGLVVGGVFVGTVAALTALTVQVTGTAVAAMGASAEQWTAAELRPLRKSGWKVINHLPMERWDIDHVLVGPPGVYAVETKWSGHGWSLDRPDQFLRTAIDQVRSNARSLRLWEHVKANGVTIIQPVLFLWGPAGAVKPDEPVTIDGITVLYGLAAARAWRAGLVDTAAPELGFEQIARVWAALDKQIARRDERELTKDPPLPSLGMLCWTSLGVFFIGFASLLLSFFVLKVLDSWWQWGLAAAGAACVSLAFRRQRPLRPFAAGWLVGLLASAVVIITWFVARL